MVRERRTVPAVATRSRAVAGGRGGRAGSQSAPSGGLSERDFRELSERYVVQLSEDDLMTLALVTTHMEPSEPEVAPGELDVATLRAAQRGERAALERFVRHYQVSVFAFLSRLTGRGTHVEDLAQEVFLRAYRALPRFELRSSARLSTWLLGIAFRLVQDERKRRRLPVAPWVEEDAPGSTPLPDAERARRELGLAFERAAAELPEEQLATFLLTELHGLDTDEVARATNTAPATVKTRLFRARARLRALLSAVWEER